MKKPAIAITVGDPNGIGPEVVLRSITHPSVRRKCTPILVGPAEVFRHYLRRYKLSIPSTMILETGSNPADIVPGKVSSRAGRVSSEAIRLAVALVQEGHARALVTAPVSKKALHLARGKFPGQTEMIQHLTNSRTATMMLVSETMRVGLATIHIPISRVSRDLSRSLITVHLRIMDEALRRDWRISRPRIAVLGLNPHAGEDGDIGAEDKTIVAAALRSSRRAGMNVEGPFPADSFFGRYRKGMYDAILAMYHDQGLIPLKMSSFGKGVNVTAGLPIVRTSPDHGTAFDIAGKGVANPGSMIEAILLAVQLSGNRISHQQKEVS